MIPLWMFPLAIAAGNTFVMKPSEKCPGAAMQLASMASEAGLPDGESKTNNEAASVVFFLCSLEGASFSRNFSLWTVVPLR